MSHISAPRAAKNLFHCHPFSLFLSPPCLPNSLSKPSFSLCSLLSLSCCPCFCLSFYLVQVIAGIVLSEVLFWLLIPLSSDRDQYLFLFFDSPLSLALSRTLWLPPEVLSLSGSNKRKFSIFDPFCFHFSIYTNYFSWFCAAISKFPYWETLGRGYCLFSTKLLDKLQYRILSGREDVRWWRSSESFSTRYTACK